jgi:hypothetical protein
VNEDVVKVLRACIAIVVVTSIGGVSSARADEPVVGHTPVSSAVAGQPLDVTIEVERPGEVRRARLRFRTEGAAAFDKADFTTTGTTRTATIPGDTVRAPAVEYFIIVQRADGAVEPVHGTPREPIRVKVPKPESNADEKPAAGAASSADGKGAPTDAKPVDDKATDAKAPDAKPVDAKPVDAKPVDAKPVDAKPVDAKPVDAKPVDAKPVDAKPVDAKPVDAKPVDAKPVDAKPVDAKPVDAKAGEPRSTDTKADAPSSANGPAASTTGETTAPPAVGGTATAPSAAAAGDGDVTGSTGERETEARVKPRRLRGAGAVLAKDPLDEEMQLWAAREQRGFLPREIAAGTFVTTSVLERRDIERLPVRHLADIVRLLPGVDITRSMLGYDVITARGQRGDARVIVFVDGMRFGNPYDGRVPWFMPVALIERVEVSLGSAVDGDGMRTGGTVIHVTTRQLNGVAAEAWGNTFTGGGAALAGGLDLGVVRMWGGLNLQGEVGALVPVDEDRYTNSAFERPPEQMVSAAQNVRGALTAGVEAPLGPVTVDARLLSVGELRGPYIGWFDTLGEDSTLTWVDTTASVGVTANIAQFLTLGTRLSLGHDYVDHNLQLTPKAFSAPAGDGSLATFEEGVQVRRAYSIFDVTGDAFARVRAFQGNALTVGTALSFILIPPDGYILEANRETTGKYQTLGTVDGLAVPQSGPCPFFGADVPLGACRATMTAYVRDEQDFFGVVKIGAGVRVIGFSDVAFDPATQVLPHVGMRVRLTEAFALRASFMSGVRAPTFEEQFDQTGLVIADLSRGVFVGNPTLRTEAFRTVDAGVESTLGLGSTRAVLALSAFGSGTDDAIEALALNGNLETYTNAGGAARDLMGPVIVGVEGSSVVEFFGGSRVFANASWFRSAWRARLDLDDEEPVCALLPGYGLPIDDPAGPACGFVTELPQFRANMGAIVDVDLLGSFSAVATLGSERRNNARTTLERLRSYQIPAYGLFSVGFRSRPVFGLGVWAQVQNLLDASVKDDTMRPDRVTGLVPREQTALWAGVYLAL